MTKENYYCIEYVAGAGFYGGKCSREAKHDPDESGNMTKCWQHSKAHAEAKEQKRNEKWEHEVRVRERRTAIQDDVTPIVREVVARLTDDDLKAMDTISGLRLANVIFVEKERRRS